jgi:predicted DNA-binding transcriptional regulator YafY
MISILLLIEAKGKIKAKDLAEELETSIRTIYRDVDSLCEAGMPLTTNTGPSDHMELSLMK